MPLHPVPEWFQKALTRLDRNLAARWDSASNRWTIQHYNRRHRCWDTILHIYYRDQLGRVDKLTARPLDRSVLDEILARDTYRGFQRGDIPRQIERRLDDPESLVKERETQNAVELSCELAKVMAPFFYKKLFHAKLSQSEISHQLEGIKDIRQLDEKERARYDIIVRAGMRNAAGKRPRIVRP